MDWIVLLAVLLGVIRELVGLYREWCKSLWDEDEM